ncbi:unnamed protein product, partial [Prunus brigantina]
MSDSESLFESEPNTLDGESSDNRQETDREALDLDSAESKDAEVVVIEERAKVAPSVAGVMDTRVLDRHVSYHSEAFIAGHGEATVDSSSRPLVTLVQQGNPRVPMRPPKELLFRVDYLDPNKITEPVRFHIPTKKNIKKVERARMKVLAAIRVYPDLLFTPNLVKAKLVGEEEMTKARVMSELSNRQLMLDGQNRKAEEPAITQEAYQQVTGKRPAVIDIDTT